MRKIFILGLPRTGTTSLCSVMLQLGFKVGHVVQTSDALEEAQVLADSPVFAFYAQLYQRYPNHCGILLQRDLPNWQLSIKQLLLRMQANLVNEQGGFHPSLKQSYQQVFGQLKQINALDDAQLANIYYQHQNQVVDFYQQKNLPLLKLNVAAPNALKMLQQFLTAHEYEMKGDINNLAMPKLNHNGKITSWKALKHSYKISPIFKQSHSKPQQIQLDFCSS